MKRSFYLMGGIQQYVCFAVHRGQSIPAADAHLLCVVYFGLFPFKWLIQLIFPVSFGDMASVPF
jgi:hypothetical protein